MRIVITRHGKAHHDSPDGTDFGRPLRPKGERQAAYLGEQLRGFMPPVGRIIASRAVRARQTATIIADALGIPLSHDEALLVDEPVGPVLDRLGAWCEPLTESGGTLVLVGHNPQLERLAAMLGGGGATGAISGLRTGEAVVCEVDPMDPASGVELERLRLAEPE